MPSYYLEVRTPTGHWSPQKHPTRPDTIVVGGVERLRLTGGQGQRVRAVQEIPGYFEQLTLSQLREVMSPDGKFRATGASA